MGHGVKKEVAVEAEKRGLIGVHEACKRLNVSRRTLGRMIREGDLHPEIIEGVRFFEPGDIDEWAADSEENEKEYVLDFALKTLVNQNEHIDKLIKLAHDPAQQTIKALLDENASLRKRAQDQEKTVVEVHELYGALLRETLLAEVEAERERANIAMKQDAMTMFKDKLVPMMIESSTSTKFLQSFTDQQIEAFIEAEAGTPEQITALKKLLKKRQKAKKPIAPVEEKGTTDGQAHS